jgi:PRTRC genetic system ThiF family protein
VGCGGIGGMLALHTARLARECQRRYDSVDVFFVDPDTVEEKNLRRQNFCHAEIGNNKAETLAYRLNAAWGLNITAIPKRFNPDLIHFIRRDTLTILIGCVDNAAARKQLHRALQRESSNDASPIWWLDGANGTVQGQILLGNTVSRDLLNSSFELEGICKNLPSPAMLHPELLIPKPDEQLPRKRSCAELALLDPQSLTINSIIASHMSDYLLRLILTGDLRRMATYIDMTTGSVRSLACTPEQIQQALTHQPNLRRKHALVY